MHPPLLSSAAECWDSHGVRLQAQKGEASSVAIILVLDERQGEVKGAL